MASLMTDVVQPFWIGRRDWPQFDPVDPKPHMFLARAALTLAPLIHGEAWTGMEPLTAFRPPISPLPERREKATPGHLFAAWRRTPQCKAPADDSRAALTRLMSVVGVNLTADNFTDELWEECRRAEAVEILERTRAIQRWHTVQDVLASAMWRRELPFALQNRWSLELTHEGRPAWWTGNNWRNHFITCQINPAQPDSPAFAGVNWMRIFVDAEAFAALCASVDGPEAGETPRTRIERGELKRIVSDPSQVREALAACECSAETASEGDVCRSLAKHFSLNAASVRTTRANLKITVEMLQDSGGSLAQWLAGTRV